MARQRITRMLEDLTPDDLEELFFEVLGRIDFEDVAGRFVEELDEPGTVELLSRLDEEEDE